MKLLTFEMEITDFNNGYFSHKVHHCGNYTEFSYNPTNEDLIIPLNGELSKLIDKNKNQLLKILKTKKLKSYYPGFSLCFVLTDGKDVDSFNDMNKIIVIDSRDNELEIVVQESGKAIIHQVFTDASYLDSTGKSGIAAIIKFPDGTYKLHSIAGRACNSCSAELEAVVSGLEILKDIEEIRLITDSRYVRKGLSEWMHNWKLNNWKTSGGSRAKNIEIWKKIDNLTKDKYLEVAWVKGHSGHFENTMCDLYARDIAEI